MVYQKGRTLLVEKIIFPVTRIHEPLLVRAEVEQGQVKDAWLGGTMYRGFELMLEKRTPVDIILFSQRICGICSTAHGIAAVLAIEQAYKLKPLPAGELLRNIMFAADILQNHLRHFYLLTLPDYVKGPDRAPFTPTSTKDFRIPKQLNDEMMDHYWKGAEMAAYAHQILAIFGAKAPHQQTIYPLGVSTPIDSEKIMMARSLVDKITTFVEHFMLRDAETLGKYYADYFKIGVGYRNLMSFGMFPQGSKGKRVITGGIVENGGTEIKPIDQKLIKEDVTFALYEDTVATRHPANGKTQAVTEKNEAYTWVKAPRYAGKPFEGGPLAREWISGRYQRGISTMDRIIARCLEAHRICRLLDEWLQLLQPGQPTIAPYDEPSEGEGVGLTDAMRGCLGHWISFKNGRSTHFQTITPTAWNFSPRDAQGQRGPVEQALLNTPIENVDELIEVGRVVRSFDPCFSCAIHLITPSGDISRFRIS